MDSILQWRGRSELVDSMFLMGSPIYLLIILASYLFFVTNYGPKLMFDKKPMRVRSAIIPYNILQITGSFLIIYGFHACGFTFSKTWRCTKNDESESAELHDVMWIFVMQRIFGLSETFFFIARKKNNQLTFLHVYHHLSSVLIFWCFFKYSGGMMEVFIVVVSEIAFIVKHSYYLLSSYTNVTRLFQLLMYIKPIMIVLQIIELVFILIHSTIAVSNACNLSSLFYIQTLNVLTLVVLYLNFFIKCYARRLNIKY